MLPLALEKIKNRSHVYSTSLATLHELQNFQTIFRTWIFIPEFSPKLAELIIKYIKYKVWKFNKERKKERIASNSHRWI